LFVVCASLSNSAGHEKRWPAPQLNLLRLVALAEAIPAEKQQ